MRFFISNAINNFASINFCISFEIDPNSLSKISITISVFDNFFGMTDEIKATIRYFYFYKDRYYYSGTSFT
ncbi:MAG: hypothetical protein B6I24_00485 [Bacteroidetes bacterium 4572_128]|nr:MAG: hypothetical protein B6I24_00485 [Bacteroidetes bacterium 4572_128]